MQPYKIKTISEYHKLLGIAKPQHPLVSVINLNDFQPVAAYNRISLVFDFYIISLKRKLEGTVKYSYGQQQYDFDEGLMYFMSPNQVFSFDADKNHKNSGWMLLIHPEFLWNTPLAKTIKQYGYFDYSTNEALFLSEKEENTITGIIRLIEQEYHANIDNFSQRLIVAQTELLLHYVDRYYNRQFITRKKTNHQILNSLEDILTQYFKGDDLIIKGLPSVSYLAENLNVSPKYLSSLLKALTGQTAQQHIHEKLIEKAKERLSTTALSVSEIAYELGFEHSQSFSKLFKAKTNLSPLEFRSSFYSN